MKTHGKVSGSAASAVLDNVRDHIEEFYDLLDDLHGVAADTMRVIKSLRDAANYLLNECDPKADIEPELVAKITKLLDKTVEIDPEAGKLLDIAQELYAVASYFEDFKADWEDVLDEASRDEEDSDSES